MKKNKKEKKPRYRGVAEFLCAIVALACFGGVWMFDTHYNPDKMTNLIVISFLALAFISISAFIILVFKSHGEKKAIRKPSGPVLGSIMYDMVNNSNEPALIHDENKKIIWYNKYALNLSSSPLLGAKLSTIIPAPVPEETDKRNFSTTIGDSTYTVEATKIISGSKMYKLLMFKNITELVNLKQFVKDEDLVVCYVIVDNLEELLQFEQERYREAAAAIETLVRDWCSSVNGILKEYEKDKYLFFFKAINLEKFIETKFEILDKVRDIRVGSGNIPVTVSVGVSKVKGNLAEKERAAHVALDLALQRGGDQAVVKYDEGFEFYGGRTNTVHKRTKVRARVAANKLAGLMASASNVIIMAHRFPDYDAFGASVGLARLAMFCGVKVNIVTDAKNPNIKKTIKFFEKDDKYRGVFVDAARGLDLIKSETLLVIADVNNPDMFESIDVYNNIYNTVIIDHHRKTSEFAKKPLIEYIDPGSSSASELVSEMLEQAFPPSTLQHHEAAMLLAGILLDTKQFTKGAGTKTFAAAMFLRDNGASYEDIQDLFKTNIEDYKQEATFGQQIDIYRHCMAIAVSSDAGSDRTLAARVADNLLGVEEVAASFALMQIGDTVHISARSNGTVNVQLILEKLKGGGRFDAAGAQVKSSNIKQVLLRLKEAIDEYLDPED